MLTIEGYLESINAKDLFETDDYPPLKVRKILKTILKDYLDYKINENILLEIGSHLHSMQSTSDNYDPNLMSITCSLDDQQYETHKLSDEEKIKLYKKFLKDLEK